MWIHSPSFTLPPNLTSFLQVEMNGKLTPQCKFNRFNYMRLELCVWLCGPASHWSITSLFGKARAGAQERWGLEMQAWDDRGSCGAMSYCSRWGAWGAWRKAPEPEATTPGGTPAFAGGGGKSKADRCGQCGHRDRPKPGHTSRGKWFSWGSGSSDCRRSVRKPWEPRRSCLGCF